MEFQRARNETQRDERRRTILSMAWAMLEDMSVADVSLNELSRRVGLAKSNVLRYFGSREAVLLELLNGALQAWIDDLDLSAISPASPPHERAEAVAGAIAQSLAARPVLCDLISAQASVLERNVSTDTVLRHKRAVLVSVEALSAKLRTPLPELDEGDIYKIIAIALLMTSGVWPHDRPTEALLAAYTADPEIGAHRMRFAPFMQEALALTLFGLLAGRVTI